MQQELAALKKAIEAEFTALKVCLHCPSNLSFTYTPTTLFAPSFLYVSVVMIILNCRAMRMVLLTRAPAAYTPSICTEHPAEFGWRCPPVDIQGSTCGG